MLAFLTARQTGLDDPLRLRRVESTRRWECLRNDTNVTAVQFALNQSILCTWRHFKKHQIVLPTVAWNDGKNSWLIWGFEDFLRIFTASLLWSSLSRFCDSKCIWLTLILVSFPTFSMYLYVVCLVLYPFRCFAINEWMNCPVMHSSFCIF